MPENPDTAAVSQVRQHLVESLRVIDDLDRFLSEDDEAPTGDRDEGGVDHDQ
ncbi:MAG: hypothetical protein L0G89_00035 [Janibacter sp.]|nr:hypothetical protein [Janibacter sp.]